MYSSVIADCVRVRRIDNKVTAIFQSENVFSSQSICRTKRYAVFTDSFSMFMMVHYLAAVLGVCSGFLQKLTVNCSTYQPGILE